MNPPSAAPVRWFFRHRPRFLGAGGQSLLVLAAFVAVLTAGARIPSRPPLTLRRAGASACPLTPAQERKAVDAFKKLVPVVQHPRCVNCHGGVDPFQEQAVGRHGGGKIDSTGGFARTQERCQECHSGLPGWELPVLPEMSFAGKTPLQLCVLFKRMKPVPSVFVRHMDNDEGRVQFTTTAYKGDRALNDMARDDWEETHKRKFIADPPPGSHDQMVADAQAWVDAMGDGYSVKPDCGCKVNGAWVGTVAAVWNLKLGDMGVGVESTTATVRFEIDPSYVPEDTVRYWSSVSGRLKWSTTITGHCSARASGSFPINKGGDDNPLAVLRGSDILTGGTRFTTGLGPLKEQDEPRFDIICPNQPPLAGVLYGQGVWWYHPIAGMTSEDGERLQGRFTSAIPLGTATWTWDLHVEP